MKNDDIDSLVEEELSRNQSEESGSANGEATDSKIEQRRGTGPVVPSVSNIMGIIPVAGKKPDTAEYRSKGPKIVNSIDGRRTPGANLVDNLTLSSGSNGESQMFKELFQTSNKGSKDKGIGGITGVSVSVTKKDEEIVEDL